MDVGETEDDSRRETVLIRFEMAGSPDEFWELNNRLFELLDSSDVGDFDGNEIGQGEATLFAYGQNSERLFRAMEPVLRSYPICRDAQVVFRRGDPGAPESEFKLWTIH
jgi:hypothetical protein